MLAALKVLWLLSHVLLAGMKRVWMLCQVGLAKVRSN